MTPGYVNLFKTGRLGRLHDLLRSRLKECTLCPRVCRVNRLEGSHGACRLSHTLRVSHALPHFGEEPPISGTNGAGTVFFSSCNLRCVYCQNYQISHDMAGKEVTVDELSRMMLGLQEQSCHNIEAVTPTPQVVPLIEALGRACESGLNLPLVYNCGGYELPDVVALLDGVVDIYLPDFKYGDGNASLRYAGVKDYHRYALRAIGEMVRQAGDVLEMDGPAARRGVIIRHLVLPGDIRNSIEVLRLIRDHISLSVPISIMAQYSPVRPVADHPSLGRTITAAEYERVVDRALDMGFRNIFVQEVSDGSRLIPDFDREEPFQWDDR
jgi:putative pyruvate formate lyase activating enzyme